MTQPWLVILEHFPPHVCEPWAEVRCKEITHLQEVECWGVDSRLQDQWYEKQAVFAHVELAEKLWDIEAAQCECCPQRVTSFRDRLGLLVDVILGAIESEGWDDKHVENEVDDWLSVDSLLVERVSLVRLQDARPIDNHQEQKVD